MRLSEWPAYQRLDLAVVGADGHELVLADGRRVLDLYGGHCVNTLGAGDPALGALLTDQWRRLSFTTNLIDHPPRQAFMDAFARNLPPGDWAVFASNSGAEANENALKAVIAETGRSRVVCFEGAFHGRTAAAAALSEGAGSIYPSTPFDVARVPFGDVDRATEVIDERVAAVIVEPIQSLAGVVDPPAGFLEALRTACDASGARLVFDEVQTGNGRLGSTWASVHFGVVPDLFTTAKGAAAGLPIGLTVARADLVARTPAGLLGSTFGGGPLALAAAAEVARRIAEPGFLARVSEAGTALSDAARQGPFVGVRGAGLLLGLVLPEGLSATLVRDRLLELGVLVGTSRDPRVIRLSPGLDFDPGLVARFSRALETLELEVTS